MVSQTASGTRLPRSEARDADATTSSKRAKVARVRVTRLRRDGHAAPASPMNLGRTMEEAFLEDTDLLVLIVQSGSEVEALAALLQQVPADPGAPAANGGPAAARQPGSRGGQVWAQVGAHAFVFKLNHASDFLARIAHRQPTLPVGIEGQLERLHGATCVAVIRVASAAEAEAARKLLQLVIYQTMEAHMTELDLLRMLRLAHANDYTHGRKLLYDGLVARRPLQQWPADALQLLAEPATLERVLLADHKTSVPGAAGLLAAITELFRQHLDAMLQDSSTALQAIWCQLPGPVAAEVLGNDLLQVTCEDTVLHAALRWCERGAGAEGAASQAEREAEVLKQVRLLQLSEEYLNMVVLGACGQRMPPQLKRLLALEGRWTDLVRVLTTHDKQQRDELIQRSAQLTKWNTPRQGGPPPQPPVKALELTVRALEVLDVAQALVAAPVGTRQPVPTVSRAYHQGCNLTAGLVVAKVTKVEGEQRVTRLTVSLRVQLGLGPPGAAPAVVLGNRQRLEVLGDVEVLGEAFVAHDFDQDVQPGDLGEASSRVTRLRYRKLETGGKGNDAVKVVKRLLPKPPQSDPSAPRAQSHGIAPDAVVRIRVPIVAG